MNRFLPASLAFAAGALAAAAQAQQGNQLVLPLSDPSRPAVLEVNLFSGDVAITAHDRSEVVIVTSDEDVDEIEREVRGGLRRIPNTSIGLTAEERDNRVSISVDWSNRDVDLSIAVPRMTSVHASTMNDDLVVRGVVGDHELSSQNGDIAAFDVGGSAVVSTMNGDVEVSFAEVDRTKPMSFRSFNGDFEITFPADFSGDLVIAAGRGDVLTDFDVELQPQAAIIERGGDPQRRQIRMEREVRARVGAGGPEIRFKTYNGNIVIRRGQ
ncbi:MAG TPA: hypothetical protein VIN61_04630 [Gammaproteobacteria bacterium]